MSARRQVIERLYAELGPALLAYATSLLGARSDAEDAVQHVFLRLIAGQAELPREPRPYLFRAVRNTCLNRRRSMGQAAALPQHLRLFERSLPDGEAVLDLERALATLPDEQREAVVLRIWGELTLDDCASVLELSPNTVASRYRYALAKLRQQLGGQLRCV